MAQIGTSWNQTSWAIPAWAANSWAGTLAPVVATGNQVVANTVARLGSLFKKTAYGVSGNFPAEPSIAVRHFLDDLKVERKKVLIEERRKLAGLKAERSKVTEQAPRERDGNGQPRLAGPSSLEIQIQRQSQVVRDARKLYEEAQKASEQERIDQLAEYALEEWSREEVARKVETERQRAIQEAEDDEMAHVLFMVHEL